MEPTMGKNPRERPLDRLLRALEDGGYRPRLGSGGEHHCKCPGHNGKDWDSLTFRETEDGSILMFCHSKKCSLSAILDPLGLEPSDLYQTDHEKRLGVRSLAGSIKPRESKLIKEWGETSRPEPEATYDYRNEAGETLYQVLRYRTEDGKTFRQRRKKGDGWEWKLGDVRRVLYNLPEVKQAVKSGQTVFLVEGEKDADNLNGLGLVATCAMGGAISKSKSWLPEWSEILRGARVIILPDNDLPGKTHAEIVAEVLRPVAGNVKIVELPGLPLQGDVSDYLEANNKENFLEVVDKTRLNVLSLAAILDVELPERKLLLSPWLHQGDLVMVHAWRGVGKTHFALGTAVALSTGTSFLGWEAQGRTGVLYIDGEMNANTLQDRIIQRMGALELSQFGGINLNFVTPDLQPDGIRRLDTPEGQLDIEEIITRNPGIDVVVIDNLSCLTFGNESDPEYWEPMKVFTLRLRRMGKTVIIVHHSGKGGAQRGTSKREDQLDTVIHLERPKDYRPQDGARFKVSFQKARNIYGHSIPELEAVLVTTPEGKLDWATRTMRQSVCQTVAGLFNQGQSQIQIARELNLSPSTVSGHMRRAREKGLIVEED